MLLWLATGGGKTLIFCIILKAVFEKKKSGLMVVRGRKLVKQASNRLAREGVPHGIMMANNDRAHHERILVASIDTLVSRGLRPRVDFIVIDEAHQATSESYHLFLADYPNTPILSVTATPFVNKPLRHLAEKIVNPISIRELVQQGFLVPPKVFAPAILDLSGIKISKLTRDYDEHDLSIEMEKPKIVGDIVDHWKTLGQNRPTLCFGVTVNHSKIITDSFNAAGIPALHCDAGDSDEYREHCIARLKSGSIKVLSNVGLFQIGVDIQEVSCMILARPTKSLALYRQQVGRGIRAFPGKSDCIILDHAGNTLEHGFVTMEIEPDLDGRGVKKSEVSIFRCPACYSVIPSLPCHCGYERPQTSERAGPEHVEGRLVAIEEDDIGLKIQEEVKELQQKVIKYGFKPGFIYAKIAEKYGTGAANFYCS